MPVKKTPLAKAQELADKAVSQMGPFCDKIMIGGSVRRGVEMVKDIEIIAVPKFEEREEPGELFPGRMKRVNLLWEHLEGLCDGVECVKLKGGDRYWQIRAGYGRRDEITVDIFTSELGNWGWTSLVRTGSAEFSHHMAKRLNAAGYTSRENWIRAISLPDKKIQTPTEDDVFRIANEKFVPAEKRCM